MFRIEITTFDEFVQFAEFLRGKELDIDKLIEMKNKLAASTDELKAAEDEDK